MARRVANLAGARCPRPARRAPEGSAVRQAPVALGARGDLQIAELPAACRKLRSCSRCSGVGAPLRPRPARRCSALSSSSCVVRARQRSSISSRRSTAAASDGSRRASAALTASGSRRISRMSRTRSLRRNRRPRPPLRMRGLDLDDFAGWGDHVPQATVEVDRLSCCRSRRGVGHVGVQRPARVGDHLATRRVRVACQ